MLRAGDIVDRYRVGRLLGSGGMASVYEVKHDVLGTRHALKVLHNRAPHVRDRLIAEGRMQAGLDPTHVVPVTDVLDVHGAPALLMPYVAGCSLEQLIDDLILADADVSALFLGTVLGVASAHEAGIVHRDLKPANILLEVKRGLVAVRVADFGLARLVETGSGHTVAGMFMGTPPYASPEQFLDTSSVDHRSDLWSLGVILYELLTGKRPFRGGSVAAIRDAVQSGTYPQDPVPAHWRPLLDRLLHVHPEQRIASATELAAQVTALVPPSDLVMGTPVAEAIRRRAGSSHATHDLASSFHTDSPPTASWPARATASPTLAAFTDSGWMHASEGQDASADDAPAPTLLPYHSVVHNLAVERDAFIGREADLATLAERLKSGGRLLTLLGLGGSGKTRLALHYAWENRQDWPGGVAFCDLAEARTLDSLLAAVGAALDVPLSGDDPVVRLGHALAGRGRILVILDNFEQLTDHAGATLGPWLDRAPKAVFLVTSREVLGLRGEHTLPLPTLDSEDATQLFIERATGASPYFDPTPDDLDAIHTLVDLLDRLPLAIELAAARTRVLRPRKLLERMSDRFKLLSSSGGRRDDRQATLRATLDWSWELLKPWEQAGLAQMAVFDGGFDLDAAEGVLDLSAYDDAPWAMDVVQALVDKSLLRAVGDDRFNMLVSVHEYASLHLADRPDAAAVELRHGAWYAGLGSPAALDALNRHGGGPRRAALLRDLDNLLAANARAVQRADAQIAGPTALAACDAAMLTAPFSVLIALLDTTLALPDLPAELAGRLGTYAGFAHWSSGDTAAAEQRYTAALAMAQACGDLRTQGLLARNRAFLMEHQGQTEQARDTFLEARALQQRIGDRVNEGRTLHGLGNVEQLLGDLVGARLHLDQALAIHREVGDDKSEAKALGYRGNLNFQEGRIAEAAADYEAARAIYARIGDRRSRSWVEGNIGVIHAERGEDAEAAEAFEAALAVHQEVGDRRTEGVVLNNLGEIYIRLGHRRKARHTFLKALEVCRDVGMRQFEAIAEGNIATLLRQDGYFSEAEARYDAALTLIRDVGDGWAEGELLGELGQLRTAQRRFDEGRTHLDDALPLLHSANNDAGIALIHAARAELEHHAGQPEAAATALAQAQAIVDRMGAGPQTQVSRRVNEVRLLISREP